MEKIEYPPTPVLIVDGEDYSCNYTSPPPSPPRSPPLMNYCNAPKCINDLDDDTTECAQCSALYCSECHMPHCGSCGEIKCDQCMETPPDNYCIKCRANSPPIARAAH